MSRKIGRRREVRSRWNEKRRWREKDDVACVDVSVAQTQLAKISHVIQ